LNKEDLTKRVRIDIALKLPPEEVEDLVDLFFETLAEVIVSADRDVRFNRFGRFTFKMGKDTFYLDRDTGKVIKKSGKRQVIFKPLKSLLTRVNGANSYIDDIRNGRDVEMVGSILKGYDLDVPGETKPSKPEKVPPKQFVEEESIWDIDLDL